MKRPVGRPAGSKNKNPRKRGGNPSPHYRPNSHHHSKSDEYFKLLVKKNNECCSEDIGKEIDGIRRRKCPVAEECEAYWKDEVCLDHLPTEKQYLAILTQLEEFRKRKWTIIKNERPGK